MDWLRFSGIDNTDMRSSCFVSLRLRLVFFARAVEVLSAMESTTEVPTVEAASLRMLGGAEYISDPTAIEGGACCFV